MGVLERLGGGRVIGRNGGAGAEATAGGGWDGTSQRRQLDGRRRQRAPARDDSRPKGDAAAGMAPTRVDSWLKGRKQWECRPPEMTAGWRGSGDGTCQRGGGGSGNGTHQSTDPRANA